MTPLLAALLSSLQPAAPPAVAPVFVFPANGRPSYRAHASPACGDWNAARAGTAPENVARSVIYRFWVQGYITGFNFVGPDPSGVLFVASARDEVYAAVDGYCTRHPSHLVVDAMAPIVAAFLRRRMQGPGIPIPPPGSRRRAMATVTTTCRQWNENRNAILGLGFGSVVRGYITAYNHWGPDPTGDAIGAADRPLIEQWVGGWCRDRPTALLIQVVDPLIRHVAAERAAGRLPPGGMRPTDGYSPGSAGRPPIPEGGPRPQ